MNSSVDNEDIVQEVTDRFTQLVAAINQKDAAAWEKYYGDVGFVSAVAGGFFCSTRNDWVRAIASNFAMRASQHLEVCDVQVFPLASDSALLTSRNRVEMQLKSGQSVSSNHVFTMIWKKVEEGWRILHSHESWMDREA